MDTIAPTDQSAQYTNYNQYNSVQSDSSHQSGAGQNGIVDSSTSAEQILKTPTPNERQLYKQTPLDTLVNGSDQSANHALYAQNQVQSSEGMAAQKVNAIDSSTRSRARGQYTLKVDPNVTDPQARRKLQAIADRFNALPGAKRYLNIPTRKGGELIISNQPESFASGNRKRINYNLRKHGRRFNGFSQGTNNNLQKKVYLNLNSNKDPLRTLIHEVGHLKWPGLAKLNPNGTHSPEFYKILTDAISEFGLRPNTSDRNGVDISNTTSPAGDVNPLDFNLSPGGGKTRPVITNSPSSGWSTTIEPGRNQ
ncbi:MAG: hypothetical protein P8163_19040 [Candidatus Thiodiazotropha sp.]